MPDIQDFLNMVQGGGQDAAAPQAAPTAAPQQPGISGVLGSILSSAKQQSQPDEMPSTGPAYVEWLQKKMEAKRQEQDALDKQISDLNKRQQAQGSVDMNAQRDDQLARYKKYVNDSYNEKFKMFGKAGPAVGILANMLVGAATGAAGKPVNIRDAVRKQSSEDWHTIQKDTQEQRMRERQQNQSELDSLKTQGAGGAQAMQSLIKEHQEASKDIKLGEDIKAKWVQLDIAQKNTDNAAEKTALQGQKLDLEKQLQNLKFATQIYAGQKGLDPASAQYAQTVANTKPDTKNVSLGSVSKTTVLPGGGEVKDTSRLLRPGANPFSTLQGILGGAIQSAPGAPKPQAAPMSPQGPPSASPAGGPAQGAPKPGMPPQAPTDPTQAARVAVYGPKSATPGQDPFQTGPRIKGSTKFEASRTGSQQSYESSRDALANFVSGVANGTGDEEKIFGAVQGSWPMVKIREMGWFGQNVSPLEADLKQLTLQNALSTAKLGIGGRITQQEAQWHKDVLGRMNQSPESFMTALLSSTMLRDAVAWRTRNNFENIDNGFNLKLNATMQKVAKDYVQKVMTIKNLRKSGAQVDGQAILNSGYLTLPSVEEIANKIRTTGKY